MQNGELSADEPCIGNMKSEEHDSELLPICELSGLVCECIDARYAPNLRSLTFPRTFAAATTWIHRHSWA